MCLWKNQVAGSFSSLDLENPVVERKVPKELSSLAESLLDGAIHFCEVTFSKCDGFPSVWSKQSVRTGDAADALGKSRLLNTYIYTMRKNAYLSYHHTLKAVADFGSGVRIPNDKTHTSVNVKTFLHDSENATPKMKVNAFLPWMSL